VKTTLINRFIFAIAFIVTSGITYASGFRLPEASVSGLSLSNAVVANTDVTGAIIYNPALMSAQEERRSVAVGLMNVSLDSHVDPDNGTPADSQGDDSIFIPNFYYTSKINSQWSWGVGLHAPFGLEIKWPAGTFGAFSNPLFPPQVAGAEPEESKIEMINLTPNASYRVDDNNSFAVGINYYDVRDLALNTQGAKISGDGNDFGFTLAYLYTRGPWNFGATYRSSVEADLDGSITAAGITAPASAKIEFPAMVQIGLRNQINQQLAVEFDIERTNWSSFDVLEVNHQHPAQTAPAPDTIPTPITNTNNWDDVMAYRLSATYQLNNKLQLRFGYTMDETPQPDKYFSPRIPDADRQLISFGAAYKHSDWEFEGGLMYIKFDNRTINSTVPYTPGGEANGTDAYNGKYKADAIFLGVGFTKTFAQ
jgi:long-chain fatty acid transport protein